MNQLVKLIAHKLKLEPAGPCCPLAFPYSTTGFCCVRTVCR